jgi:hypothetical protein
MDISKLQAQNIEIHRGTLQNVILP